MTARREVMFLAHRIPYPPDKGDKIRSWRLVRRLAADFDVHLAAFVDAAEDFAHRDVLENLCKSVALIRLDPWRAKMRSAAGLLTGEPLSFAYYRDGAMRAAIEKIRRRDLAAEIVFSSSMAPYVLDRSRPATPLIVDLCDADSAKWRDYAKARRGPMRRIYAREYRRLARAETEIINRADASFAVSPEEAALLNDRPGLKKRCKWFGNGVDTDYFAPLAADPGRVEKHDVVFTGAMDYAPNVDAVVRFAADVWPIIRAARPAASLVIAGARPAREVRALAEKDGVIVTGRLDDIRPAIADAQIAIAPMRIARGVQNKVLEAMAMARPVVASAAAAKGIETTPGEDIVIAENGRAFAEEILSLLADAPRRKKIGEAARRTMQARYSWDAQLAKFDEVLHSLAPAAAAMRHSAHD